MKPLRGFVLTLAVLATGCGSSPPRPPPAPPIETKSTAILIPRVVPFDTGVGTDHIRQECDFAARVPQQIVEVAAKLGVAVQMFDGDPKRAKGRVLTMRTVEVHALPGGGATWFKYARIDGELREGGRVIGDFQIRRRTGGGFRFSTCGALGHVGDALGADIAKWLKNPQPGTRKGVKDSG